MFDQQKYINSYMKQNYKSLKIRIRKDDKLLMKKLSDVKNVNQYISSLIMKDIFENARFNFINDDIKIDFELSPKMKNLIKGAEKADLLNKYGTYMNYAYAIDAQGKKETTHHQLRESQWNKLTERYCL